MNICTCTLSRRWRSALRRRTQLLLLAGTCAALPVVTQALAIEVSPVTASTTVGGSVGVDVLATDPGGLLIGTFDIVVSWDPTVLALASSTFGTALGGPLVSLQLEFASGDSVEMLEVSFLDPLPQDGVADVVLFSLLFDALAAGSSALTVAPGSDPTTEFLGDELGFAIVPTSVGSGRIEVAAVPGPASWLLLAAAGLLAVRRQRELRT